ncbi:MAG: hypothetical protein ACR2P6_02480 [Gammaproteobacteria bacterium]
MSGVPAFLEISIPASNVLESLEWYLRLGFHEIPVGDTRDYHYAVVSDGRVCIGLHDLPAASFGLSFVLPDVARHARDLIDQGIEPEYARIGLDQFHELVLQDPDDQAATLLEAGTFSQLPDDATAPPILGQLSHLSLACSNLERSLGFWQDYGFTGVAHDKQHSAELYGTNIKIELHEGARRALLNFTPDDGVDCLARLDRLSMPYRPSAGGILLTAPDGTGLWVASGD